MDMNEEMQGKIMQFQQLQQQIQMIAQQKYQVEMQMSEIDRTIEELGKAFPSAKKVIIDDRNIYMAEAIKKINQDHENIVAVIGDGHVEGIKNLLTQQTVETIRLSQLREKEPEHVDEVTVSYEISYDDGTIGQ